MNTHPPSAQRTPPKRWWRNPWLWALLSQFIFVFLFVVPFVRGFVSEYKKARIGNAGQATAVAQMNNLTVALISYRANCGAFPTEQQGLQALVSKPTIPPIPARWKSLLESIPHDPWNHPYVYRIPSTDPAMAYDLLSHGPDGVPSADDIVVSAP